MNPRGRCCCEYSGECLEEPHHHNYHQDRTFTYGIFKSLVFFIVTTLVAMTVSHICDKFSTSTSIRSMRTDFESIRDHLNILAMEIKHLIETQSGGEMRRVTDVESSMNDDISKYPDTTNDDSSILQIVKREIQKYDSDKTGLTDFALESLGGVILSTRDTENYATCLQFLWMFNFFCEQQNSPRSVIQPTVHPGECWAFKGSTGSIVIQLITSVSVTGLTLEHISPLIAPTDETSTAPRDFSLLGLQHVNDKDGFLLGKFKYDNCESSLQYFPIQREATQSFQIIEVEFHNNSGNPEFTCIYRIRIHGKAKQGKISKT